MRIHIFRSPLALFRLSTIPLYDKWNPTNQECFTLNQQTNVVSTSFKVQTVKCVYSYLKF